MSVQTTPRVLAFARAQYRIVVEGFLDDPFGYVGYDLQGEQAEVAIRASIAEFRSLGADLDVDFDALVEEVGSPHEISRIRGFATN